MVSGDSEQSGTRPLPFVGRFSVNGTEEVAQDIRHSLGIDAALRRSVGSWSGYLTRLSQNAQSIGILVMGSGTVGSDNF